MSISALMVHRKNAIRRTAEDRVVDTVVYILCAATFIAAFYPFYLSVVLAFNEGKDATYGGIYFWPRTPTLDNFAKLIADGYWGLAMLVTFARTLIGTACTVFVTTLVSYGLSHQNLVGRKVYMLIFIGSMYFGGGIIPYYMLLKQLHLVNTFWVYIVPGMLSNFYVFVSISFFQGLPTELSESARLDGATEFQIFIRIILPLCLPLLATIAIFTAVGHWNSWYDCAFYTQDKELRTMAYQLMAVINKSSLGQKTNMDAYSAQLANDTITNMSVQMAAMIVAVTPILVVYPFFQRYFISGLTIGSVKG